jgi:hypothetical protein
VKRGRLICRVVFYSSKYGICEDKYTSGGVVPKESLGNRAISHHFLKPKCDQGHNESGTLGNIIQVSFLLLLYTHKTRI